jgi:hypothetical protein
MDTPLTKWYCDVCNEHIENVNDGYVIWKKAKDLKSYSFKIIHQCRCDQNDYPASRPLKEFLGEQGLVYLLSKLSIGPIKKYIGQGSDCTVVDMDEFVDFVRRVQIPYYEEARRYFGNPDLLENFSHDNEYLPYLPEQLEKIIRGYSENR